MTARRLRLPLLLLLGLVLLLPGCFDYDLELVLKPQLNGSFTATLELPASLAQDYAGGPDEIVKPQPISHRSEVAPGLERLVQTAFFDYPTQLEARRVRFKLERVDLGLLGIRNDTFRLTGWLRSLEGDRPDRDQPLGTEMDNRLPAGAKPARPEDPEAARAQELLAASLAGRYLTMTWVLPGKIVKTWGLNIGGRRVEPQVEANQGRVVWRIPLALLATARVRHTLVFRADFTADLKFKAENIHGVESTWTAEKPLPGQQGQEKKQEATQPGAPPPGAAQPEAAQPGAAAPEATQP